MNKTIILLSVLAISVLPFIAGCEEGCKTSGCKISASSDTSSLRQQLMMKDEEIARLKQENRKLEAKVDMSRTQLEQSANMMMDAFKQSQAENKRLLEELKTLKVSKK